MSKFFQFNNKSENKSIINIDYIIYFGTYSTDSLGIFLHFVNEKFTVAYQSKEERDKDYARLTEFVLKTKHKSE